MEAPRGDDLVTFGDDSTEDNYQSASDTLAETKAGVLDSTNNTNTVKSAVGMFSEGSPGLEGDQGIETEVASLGNIREEREKGQRGSHTDSFSAKENQPERNILSYSKNMIEDPGLSGAVASDDWSVVDPIPEAQSVVPKNVGENEKQEIHQVETASYDSSLTAETKTRENEPEESTTGSSLPIVDAEAEIEELAAETFLPKFRSADCAREPEIQEMDDSPMSPHGSLLRKSSVDRVPSSYSDKSTSLRRRNRLSRITDAGSNSLEYSVAHSYPPVSQGRVCPSSHESDSTRVLKDRPKEHTGEWDKRSTTKVGTAHPMAAQKLKGKPQLQGAQSDIAAFGSSVGQNETVNVEPGGQRRSFFYPSGYDSETDDDDEEEEAGSGLTRLGRRSANMAPKKNEEGADLSSSRDGERLTPGRIPRREVYTIPDSDVELEQGRTSTPFLSGPAELLVQAIGFQVKLIIQVMAVSLSMFNFACSLVTRPVHQTMLVKDRATEMATGAVNQSFGLISQVTGGVAQTGPIVTKLSKKTIMGCLGSAYVIFVLSLLLIPAFFIDLFLVSRIVEEPVQVQEILNFDYTEARPSATVPILSGRDLDKAKSLPLDKLVSFRKIPAGHKFHINVILTMPDSEYNIRLGMFQVTAEMISARNQVLMRQSKPCMLRFTSTPIRLFKTMLYSIPLLMGFSTEAQKLEITVLQAQEKLVPTASVRILLEPKAGYLQGGGLPELYEAELLLESALPWPKAAIRRWKWTFYVWNGICLFLFEVAMILCCCRQVLLPGLGRDTSSHTDKIITGEVKNSAKEENATKKSKNKKRVCFEDDIPRVVTKGGEDSSLPGNRSEEADHLSNNSDDSDVGAVLSMPPLEVDISTLQEKLGGMDETVKKYGVSLVKVISKDLGQALTNVNSGPI